MSTGCKCPKCSTRIDVLHLIGRWAFYTCTKCGWSWRRTGGL